MLIFDKVEIRNNLTLENIYELLNEWGGEPEYTNFGIISSTICHNPPGTGSKKLYYYENSKLFRCYSGCEDPTFDIFQLAIKIMEIQKRIVFNLNDSVRWIAQHFGFSGTEEFIEEESLEDWKHFSNYERIQSIETNKQEIILKEYDKTILSRFNYSVQIKPWLEEEINEKTLRKANIGYYPGGDQITIPHYDINNRFIGLRGRTLCADEGERYGKYRPLKINKVLYNHPLGFNLYGLNWAKNNIVLMKKVIVFESEKSVLKYLSYFGIDNSIAVACCGSSLSAYQVQLLLSLGVEEIIIAFDKQYKNLNTEESKIWQKKLVQIYNKYKNNVIISFLWDKENLLEYKNSPIDEGPEKFLKLFKERIIL